LCGSGTKESRIRHLIGFVGASQAVQDRMSKIKPETVPSGSKWSQWDPQWACIIVFLFAAVGTWIVLAKGRVAEHERLLQIHEVDILRMNCKLMDMERRLHQYEEYPLHGIAEKLQELRENSAWWAWDGGDEDDDEEEIVTARTSTVGVAR
jgi:hypothetical protein